MRALRALIIGLALIPLNNYLIIQMELVRDGIFPTVVTLVFTVIFLLFVLTLLNEAIRRVFPTFALRGSELATIYCLLACGTALAGCDVGQTLVLLCGCPYWFATLENRWAQTFHHYLHSWLTVSDKDVLEGFYHGGTTLYVGLHYKAWLPPAVSWLCFIAIMVLTMFCLNALVRKQWIEAERLSFPITTLPLKLSLSTSSLLSNRLFWTGFGIAAFFDVLNGFNFLYPTIPRWNCKILFNLNDFLTSRPWNAIGWLPVTFYPFAFGLGFLMPLDMSLSCWVFYWLWKVERIIGSYFGYQSPWISSVYAMEQMGGVWLGIFAMTLWTARHHWKAMLQSAMRLGIFSPLKLKLNLKENGDDEAHRRSMFGAAIGFVIMTVFCWAMGMSAWVAFAYTLIYLALSLTLTRIRAELGPPAHDMYGAGPDHIFSTLFGTKRFGGRDLTAISMLYWLNRESYRSHVMPAHLESLKIAREAHIDVKTVWAGTYAAAIWGGITTFWIVLHLAYKLGAEAKMRGPARWFATEGFNRLNAWLTSPTQPNKPGIIAMGVGFFFSVGLLLARTRWVWFPLHPVGYCVTSWWALNLFWFPLLLSWLTKTLILRYLGFNGYRKALPFFIGLICGEYFVGVGWQVAGLIGGFRAYAFWV